MLSERDKASEKPLDVSPRTDRIDRLVLWVLVILIPIGVLCLLIGSFAGSDRLLLGGGCLALSGFAGASAYVQLRTGKVIVPNSWLSRQLVAKDKTDRPLTYWAMTLMYLGLFVLLLGYATVILSFGPDVIDGPTHQAQ